MSNYDLPQICADIRAHRGSRSVAVVAIDGPSGGGKSCLATRLGAALGEFVLVPVDGLVPGWDGLGQVPGLLAPLLRDLATGRPGSYRSWDWHADRPGSVVTVAAARYVIVDGCGSGSTALADLLTYLIYLDVPVEVRRDHVRRRDGALYPQWDRWAAQEAVLFVRERTRERADLVLDRPPPMR